MSFKRTTLFAVLMLLASGAPAWAQLPPLLSAPDLPTEIQDCIDAGVCSTPTPIQSSEPASTLFRPYRYVDSQSGSPVDKLLLQYAIGGSAENLVGSDRASASSSPISGVAWLSADASYDVSNPDFHEFVLYTDQVSGGNHSFSGLDNRFTLETDALLAGGGGFLESETQSISTGLFSSNLPLCLAGCFQEGDLSLLNFSYSVSGSRAEAVISPESTWNDGGQLFSFANGTTEVNDPFFNIPASFSESRFVVGAVPEPTSGMLIVASTFALVFRRVRSN